MDPDRPVKPPVVRGARACTVCRAAKMKCVVDPDQGGDGPCQRCKRTNVDCVFEKHKRGRKPGSKLSEASKMLRRLEKGLNNAKMKSQAAANDHPTDPSTSRSPYSSNHNHSTSTTNGLLRPYDPSTSQPGGSATPAGSAPVPIKSESPYHPKHGRTFSASSTSSNANNSNSMNPDEEDDADSTGRASGDAGGMFPAKLIRSEARSNAFFRTILNPEDSSPSPTYRSSSYSHPHSHTPAHGHTHSGDHKPSISAVGQTGQSGPGGGGTRSTLPTPAPPLFSLPPPPTLHDPIDSGLITVEDAKTLFDTIFLRLNPFVNLFDPALHTSTYIRHKCPFLFTTLIMAACKFFKPECYRDALRLANEFAVMAFRENWKRVEVVQAFACLTYWREPNIRDPGDNRTWTHIGYACRMAVELNLNRYVPVPPPTETEHQRLERRNRERTYLVLFVHDRSLSTQHGKPWMLPECELVRNAGTWHEQGGGGDGQGNGKGMGMRPEDVILASFVQLRRIVAETTDLFYIPNAAVTCTDVNHEVVLRNCNANLKQWAERWRGELERAGGETFHWSFINMFHVYVKLFLNSFGIKASLNPSSRERPSLQPLYICFTNAMEALRIVSEDFAGMSMLSYSQDSITVMSAYSAVFLLRLLRSSNTLTELEDNAMHEIYARITKVAEAYYEASLISPACTSISYHSRFIGSLVRDDIFNNTNQRGGAERERFEEGAGQNNQQMTTIPMPAMPPNSSSTGYLQPAPPPPLQNPTQAQVQVQSGVVPGGPAQYPPHLQHPSHVQQTRSPPSQHVGGHYMNDGTGVAVRGGDADSMSLSPQTQLVSPQTPHQRAHPHPHPHAHTQAHAHAHAHHGHTQHAHSHQHAHQHMQGQQQHSPHPQSYPHVQHQQQQHPQHPPHPSPHPHGHPGPQQPQPTQHGMYQHHPHPHHPHHPQHPQLATMAPHSTEMDAQYWKNMFTELGFGEGPQPHPHSHSHPHPHAGHPQAQQQQQPQQPQQTPPQQPHQPPQAQPQPQQQQQIGMYRHPYPNDMRHHT